MIPKNKEYSKEIFGLHMHRPWKALKSGGQHMAIAEREHIMGVWGGAACGVQGQSPWSEGQGAKPLKLKAF